MSILVNKDTKLIVQGITGSAGAFHARGCRDYGTQVVGGVTPSKGGTKVDDMPVFNTVVEAVKATGATATMIFVPAAHAAGAILEAAAAGLPLIVTITEGIPVLDMARVKAKLADSGWTGRLIGPNGPGLITPGECKVGIMPGYIHKPGTVAVISRSGTLTYEAVWQLTQRGIGQSTVIGIGGDPINGSNFIDLLALFEKDPQTEAVLLIGEIGGRQEDEAADYFKKNMSKPVAAFIAGQTAPPGRRMGHAGAIIEGASGTAAEKMKNLEKAGIRVAASPEALGETVAAILPQKIPGFEMTFRDFIYSFIPIFVAMNIGGILPAFLSLTKQLTTEEKRHVSTQALITAFLISVAFIVAGQFIFQVLGITSADFKIAGGLLLLVLAVVELVQGEQHVVAPGVNVGPVPLGTPLIVGPAVLTSLLILISLRGYPVTLLALMANLLLVGLAFKFSHVLVKLIGQNGLRATSQVVSLFLAAIAVSMIRRGIESLR